MKNEILIVEDDNAISRLIQINLEMVGYKTKIVKNGLDAVNIINNNKFDLIILDIMLPGLNGFEIIEKVNANEMPIIFLTAKIDVLDKVKGLKLGADDYMTKPFEAIELLARIETVLKRYGKEEKKLTFKSIEVFIEQRKVKINDEIINLSHKEFELLCLLIKNKNRALSREQILSSVWEMDFYGGTRTVDMHIKSLRQKLKLKNEIKTIYKIGYRLEE
jgi:DNA-binding response OmpR family regulator